MQSLKLCFKAILTPKISICHTSRNLSISNVPDISRRRKWSKHGVKDEEIKYLSVEAYSVCEEFRLDRFSIVLSSLKDFQSIRLPPDSMNQVIHLQARLDNHSIGQEQIDSDYSLIQPRDIYLFEKGSAVFWNVPQEESEQLDYTYDSDVDRSKLSKGNIVLRSNASTLQLDQFAFSHAIALSVKLGIWESLLDDYIQSIGWVTNCMKSGSKIDLTRDQVFRKTGELFELKHQLNLNSDLLDTPDFYWDRQDLEDIFTKTISFMNVRKRTSVMNEKLNHCYELMDLLSSHMNDKHHVRLEWMIIVLIMVEVLFEIAHFL